jgi:hypothetical protein
MLPAFVQINVKQQTEHLLTVHCSRLERQARRKLSVAAICTKLSIVSSSASWRIPTAVKISQILFHQVVAFVADIPTDCADSLVVFRAASAAVPPEQSVQAAAVLG